jgi:hypothetical protein
MRRVSIWASGLLASAIPFVFVGAVIAFGACVFEAAGQHAPPAHSEASFQAEATPPGQLLALASADAPADVAQRKLAKQQLAKRAHGDARHHDAGPPIEQTLPPARPNKYTPGSAATRRVVAQKSKRPNLVCNWFASGQCWARLFNVFND